MTSLYWIHHPSQTDIFNQGYVGVSNRLNRRLWEHKNLTKNVHFCNAVKKYGWENLSKDVVLIADEKYCLDIEEKLRPQDQIGWNIVKGGGMPPKLYGNKVNVGKVPWNKGMKGQYTTRLKGVARTQELKEKLKVTVTCPHCNLTGGLGGMSAYHFDNCKGHARKFKARVTIGGKRIYLGVFATKKEAIAVELKFYNDANKPLPSKFVRNKKDFIMEHLL